MTSIGKIFTFLLIMTISFYSWGQNLGGLKGVVSDDKNGEPLPNVGITLVGTYISTVSDF